VRVFAEDDVDIDDDAVLANDGFFNAVDLVVKLL